MAADQDSNTPGKPFEGPDARPRVDEAAAGSAGSIRLFYRLALLAAIALAFLIYSANFGLTFLGHDTYPIIATARIQSYDDLADTFTRELMDGRYPMGHFYRPVLNLSAALDYAIWGLRPWGFQLTDLVILGLSACFLMRLLRAPAERAARSAFLWAAAIAGLFFLTHPVHLNILPVMARRGDSLSLLFILLALAAAGSRTHARFWAPALLALLAAGAKETGALAPALVFLYRFLFPAQPDERVRFAARLRQSLAVSLPAFAALGVFFIARQAVLGGLGGHQDLSPGKIVEHALEVFANFERFTFYPFPIFERALPDAVVRTILPVLFAAGSLVLLRRSPARELIIFAWIWLILGWAVHGLSQTRLPDVPWYALHTVAPFALIAGLLVQGSARALARGVRPAARAAAGAAGFSLVVLLAVNVAGSPLFADYPEWREGSAATVRFLDTMETLIAEAPDGSAVPSPPLPYKFEHREGSPISRVACLADYSFVAWAELEIPHRKIRVAFRGPAAPPEPDEVLVLLRYVP